MPQIIFYSWQADLPNNCNRGLIQEALAKAIEGIKTDAECSLQPVIDRDTYGVPGSPDISATIFAKIDSAAMFVADVSIIDTSARRPCPNPNVLFELGYAVKTLGWDRVLMVMNTEHGAPEQLPFDLRARRVVPYSATADGEKAPARNGLSKTFDAAIRLSLAERGDVPSQAESRPTDVAARIGDADRKLFSKFLEELPSSRSISFIDQHNMAGFSFPGEPIRELERFHVSWGNAEHEFLDQDLESLRSKLYGLIGEYIGLIAVNTFPVGATGRFTVPAEWEERNPEKFFEVVGKLHDTAAKIVAAHQELVRLGRRKCDAL